jgi:hypothetical protein
LVTSQPLEEDEALEAFALAELVELAVLEVELVDSTGSEPKARL